MDLFLFLLLHLVVALLCPPQQSGKSAPKTHTLLILIFDSDLESVLLAFLFSPSSATAAPASSQTVPAPSSWLQNHRPLPVFPLTSESSPFVNFVLSLVLKNNGQHWSGLRLKPSSSAPFSISLQWFDEI